MDHVLTEDEGLETTGIATVDDIVLEMQAEDIIASDDVSDDEADHEPPTKPSHSEFIKCPELVTRYWSGETFLSKCATDALLYHSQTPNSNTEHSCEIFYTTRILTICL